MAAVPTVTARVESIPLCSMPQDVADRIASPTLTIASRRPSRNPVSGEFGSSPNSGLSVSPVKMISTSPCTDGISVSLIHVPASIAASRTLKRKSTNAESSSSPNSESGPW